MTNQALYRLYAEDTDADLTPLIHEYLGHIGATVTHGNRGFYGGHEEYSVTIEVIAPDTRETAETIAGLATAIATIARQDAVLVAKMPVLSLTKFGATNTPPGRD